MLIYLTGYMGSGKSKHGRDAARRLGYRFVDLDSRIEQHAGMPVKEIFARYGEALFREMEVAALRETTSLENTLVATGGGTPCFEENLRILKSNGWMVYLKMHPASLTYRLKRGAARRPLLAPHLNNLEQFITHHLTERENWYRQAHLVLKGEGINGKVLAGELQQLLEMNHPETQG